MQAQRISTISDAACLASTSTATVSHVLNSRGRASAETRRRVLAVVRKLKYHPNHHARNLAARTSRTLGIIVSDIANPFFPAVMKSFEERARRQGYEVLVSDTDYRPQLLKRGTQRMLEHKVRGVAVLTSEMSGRLVQELSSRHIGVVTFDLRVPGDNQCTLMIDYIAGVCQAVEHLYALGHRQIAFITRQPLSSIAARRSAYMSCMRALGLKPGPILPSNQRVDGGIAAGAAIARMSRRPTAIIATNDLTAIGAASALYQHGLQIPRDVSVVGFDNADLARTFIPPLRTEDLHPDLLGRLAADSLHEISTAAKPHRRECRVPSHLVVQQSTGPAPSRAEDRRDH